LSAPEAVSAESQVSEAAGHINELFNHERGIKRYIHFLIALAELAFSDE